jgi:hypothetical protein
MPESSLPVEHLFTFTASVAIAGMVANGPSGTRVIVEASSGTVEGPKLKGTVKAPGGDWVTARPDGSIALDVRVLIETHDGANILMTYRGMGAGGPGRLLTGVFFEAGEESYRWLNNVMAIGVGASDGQTVTYEVYQVL